MPLVAGVAPNNLQIADLDRDAVFQAALVQILTVTVDQPVERLRLPPNASLPSGLAATYTVANGTMTITGAAQP